MTISSASGSKKVLIVDDDADLSDMVVMLLASAGMSPSWAANGQAMLEFLQTKEVDLILMDIYLGDSDGRALSLQLKQSAQYQAVPILLYSAGADISKESIRTSLADDFIAKPFDADTLLSRIERLLNS